ncbi:hypothetical protein [Mitsuaria sp. BK037]|uniref:hypothetical protein n=1 Tax=Mitsuaria sp. BK037 TaxID=2587122 RepID=UPI001609531D|nr:hypothetical protein [Mitsuaria sp. BK037]MBB3281061.1 hypothetical protein [Mitsuaria sp. BK037]
MNFIASAGPGLLDRLAASRAAASFRPAGVSSRAADAVSSSAPSAGTRVTLDAATADAAVYARPSAPGAGPRRVWAKAGDDGLSELMSRNSGKEAHTLSDRWRGLGGALLKQLADTGERYRQTLADVVPALPDAGATDPAASAANAEGTGSADPAAAAAALQQQALSGVATNATTVSLKVQTRSGQTVELKIGVNSGESGGTRGLQVEVSSSGPLSGAERDALALLSDGLDRALEGLGDGVPTLDLLGLTGFDADGVLTGLDLRIDHPDASADRPGQLRSFSLQLGAEKKSLSLRTTSGEMALEVDAAATSRTTTGAPASGRRWSAIDQLLQQVDAAAERSHADAAMTKSFKDAFRQLQAPPADPDETRRVDDTRRPDAGEGRGRPQDAASLLAVRHAANTGSSSGAGTAAKATTAAKGGAVDALDPSAMAPMSDGLRAQAQSLRSGLADFQASFSADSQRTSRIGSVQEAGHADYRIGQTTSERPNAATGGRSITQTQTETLSASFQKSRTYTLDRAGGNYDATTVEDSKTVTTLIDTTRDSISRAMRRTDEQRRKTFTEVENHRAASHQEWPDQRSVVERLR